MAYIKDTGTPGANNAELPIGAVLDTGAKTLSLEVGTAVPSAVVLEEKQWIVLETRNINGTANLTGECIYSEDATDLADILTFVNDVRTRMVALHTTFDISATYYKTKSVVDIYRGDEATAATLEAVDTGITLAPPPLWSIDDLTPFAPAELIADVNLIVDSGCDDPSEWELFGGWSIGGSQIACDGNDAAFVNTSETLEEGSSYDVSIDCKSISNGFFRFYLGGTVSGGFVGNTGVYTIRMTAPSGVDRVTIQSVSGLIGTFDDFKCVKV